MTKTLSTPARPATRRTPSRWAIAILMPVGPAAVAVLRYLLPYDTNDDSAAMVASVANHLTAQGWVVALSMVALFTLVPGAYAVLSLTRPRAPRLTAVVAALLVPGYLGLFGGGTSSDLVAYGGLKAGISQATLVEVIDAMNAVVAPNVGIAVFVFGHVIGTILLGVALWRSGVLAPAWAVAMAVSQPLHLLAALTGNNALDLFAWGLTSAAMAAAALVLLRAPDRAEGTAQRRGNGAARGSWEVTSPP